MVALQNHHARFRGMEGLQVVAKASEVVSSYKPGMFQYKS